MEAEAGAPTSGSRAYEKRRKLGHPELGEMRHRTPTPSGRRFGHDGKVNAGRYERTRAKGRALLREHLGLEPDLDALLSMAESCLGADRLGRCVALVRGMRLSQRYHGLSAIAALVAGTRGFGEGWWTQPHEEAVVARTRASATSTPDQRLDLASATDQQSWPPTLVELSCWIAYDAAVAVWGPLVDDVDLNDPRGSDRIRSLPADAVVGQRLTARFDVGGVVDAIVEEREGGALGTRLVVETRYSVPAQVDWAWAVALAPPGPFPLPGDSFEVYGPAVDRHEADRLRDEALAFNWPPDGVGLPWITRGDVCAALARLDWPWLDGLARSFEWERAASALIDVASV